MSKRLFASFIAILFVTTCPAMAETKRPDPTAGSPRLKKQNPSATQRMMMMCVPGCHVRVDSSERCCSSGENPPAWRLKRKPSKR